MNKKIGIIIALLVIATLIWFIEFRGTNTVVIDDGTIIELGIVASEGTIGKNIGEMAPNWRLESFDGKIIELADLRGSPVMLDFFADWCPFCHEEFPFIEEAHKTYKTKGLIVIGVHRSDTESIKKGESFARGAGATFDLVKDEGGDVYGTMTSGRAMPISFFIDTDGIIRDKILGPKTPEMLQQSIAKILINK